MSLRALSVMLRAQWEDDPSLKQKNSLADQLAWPWTLTSRTLKWMFAASFPVPNSLRQELGGCSHSRHNLPILIPLELTGIFLPSWSYSWKKPLNTFLSVAWAEHQPDWIPVQELCRGPDPEHAGASTGREVLGHWSLSPKAWRGRRRGCPGSCCRRHTGSCGHELLEADLSLQEKVLSKHHGCPAALNSLTPQKRLTKKWMALVRKGFQNEMGSSRLKQSSTLASEILWSLCVLCADIQ